MPLGDALVLLHHLCVDGESPDDIDVIENEFRQMDIDHAESDSTN